MKTKLSVLVWLLTLALFIVSVLVLGQSLPERVATHFNGSGQPDGWMPRSAHLRFFLLFGTGISGFLIVLCYLARFFPRSTLNVPNKDYWQSPEHYPEACAFVFRHSFWLGALILVWSALLHYGLVQANRTMPVALNPVAIAVATGGFLVGLGLWIWPLVRFFRKA